jgi:hypothetical protein
VALVERRLKPVASADPRRVARLIADLGSDDFEVRKRAERELVELGDLAGPALRKVAPPALEARRRIGRLLERLEGPVTDPGRLRALRALELLEYVGTAEARRVLRALAGGATESRLTREARATLRRRDW